MVVRPITNYYVALDPDHPKHPDAGTTACSANCRHSRDVPRAANAGLARKAGGWRRHDAFPSVRHAVPMLSIRTETDTTIDRCDGLRRRIAP